MMCNYSKGHNKFLFPATAKAIRKALTGPKEISNVSNDKKRAIHTNRTKDSLQKG